MVSTEQVLWTEILICPEWDYRAYDMSYVGSRKKRLKTDKKLIGAIEVYS